ncbi:acetoacetyl-CoA synthetase, partial [Nephila pilipes]
NRIIGEIGEIVVRKSIPGLFLGMWNDKDGSIYREKYFSKYQGVFAMSDFGIQNPVTKNWIIVCRSDETLKQRGCRFGSSEIYNIVEELPEIRDSLCVSQYNKDLDERAVLFLKIRDGHKYNEELIAKIRKEIENALTVRHVPDVILEVKDIPYNLNGKKVEIVVKRIINKLPYNKDSLENPDCLQSLQWGKLRNIYRNMELQKVFEVQVMRTPKEQDGKVVKKFKKIIEEKYGVKLNDYWAFYDWSINNLCEFWKEMWDFLGIISSKRFDKVLDLNVPMSESPKWFEGAKLNYAENLLRYRDDNISLIVTGEERETETVTYKQMYEEAKLYAAAFRKFGVRKGDIVVCYMSNRKEAFFAMHATVSIGAIWTGSLPLIGVQAALSRFKQVNPKICVTVDSFLHQGEEIDMLPKLKEIAEGLPSLEKIIIVPSKSDSSLKDISTIKNSCFLEEFLSQGLEKDGSVPDMKFEQVSFSHPVIISYTSGTTGIPKAIVHGCGVLMSIVNAFEINSDCDRNSVWLSVSPMGWATWTLAATLHFTGQTIVIFEGVPYYLTPTYMWDLVDKYKITNLLFPTSIIDEFQKRGYVPTPKHCLDSLKYIIAGGSVVKPQNFDFMYQTFKDVMFFSSYGCTETMGACLVGETSLPVYRGEINAIALGTAMEILDEAGNLIYGEMGDIVLSKPVPSLPVCLWGDSDGLMFREKYFSKYPDKFTIGDYGIRNPVTKGVLVCCRSDETLKQRGCRFGSSEIYNVVDFFSEVDDSLCVSQYNKNMDERAVLFLKIKKGYSYNEELVNRIRKAIEKELTVRHVPDVIMETKDIPYNINGKKVEIIVKKIINKLPYDSGTVINPECLQNFHNVPELNEF